MKFSRKLTAAAAIVVAGFATNVAAETASDTIEVYAGLASVLEMTCSDVNFGVWLVPTGDRGVATYVILDEGSIASAIIASDLTVDTTVALSNNYDNPAVGLCNVTGSAVSDANGEATITNEHGSFLGTSANPFATGFDAPTEGPPSSAFYFTLYLSSETPSINSNGEATFEVLGTMHIPNNLVTNNYGAYKNEGSATVGFDDAPDT